jgi:hypothetical protein
MPLKQVEIEIKPRCTVQQLIDVLEQLGQPMLPILIQVEIGDLLVAQQPRRVYLEGFHRYICVSGEPTVDQRMREG